MPYYVITGRVHGDDEDSCEVYAALYPAEARQKFINDMRQGAGITEHDACTHEEWTYIYITSVCASETPITIIQ